MLGRYVRSFVEIYRQYGLGIALKEFRKKLRQWRKRYLHNPDRATLQDILQRHAGQPIIVFNPLVDWHVPLFQRPQHIAINLARLGYLYFYCTPNMFDDYTGFVRHQENLYITDCFDELIEQMGNGTIFHVYAQNPYLQTAFFQQQQERGNLILYEYIDELHNDLGIDRDSIESRHLAVLRNERHLVVATSGKLMTEVLQHRSANCLEVGNGVDCRHFSQVFTRNDAPAEIVPLLASGRPIIGYFGALASWFDYELVMRLATERADFQILLIGWDYDHSLQNYQLHLLPNVTVIGPIDYQELPRYACWFTVSTIPFRINEITESTSPIKLFEYMALGQPIVTTALPECRKYRSVLIGEDHDGFVRKIDEALVLRGDEAYGKVMHAEAEENSWEAKARAIDALLRKNLDSRQCNQRA